MEDFKNELQTLNVDDFQASQAVPWDETRQFVGGFGGCFGGGFGRCFNCFNCFRCGGCFGRCGGCFGRCGGCGGCGRCGGRCGGW